MQSKLKRALERRFKNEIGTTVRTERSKIGELFLLTDFEAHSDVQLSLRFIPHRNDFRLIFTWPSCSQGNLCDLFLFNPGDQVNCSGFWMDSRFLDGVRDLESGFRIDPPDFALVSQVLLRSKKDPEQQARVYGYSVEKYLLLRDGYFIENPDRVTSALKDSLPDWSGLHKAAAILEEEAMKATVGFSRILSRVMTAGVDEFLLKLNCLENE